MTKNTKTTLISISLSIKKLEKQRKKKRKVLVTKYLPMTDRNARRKEREIEAGIRRFLRKLGKRIERAGSRISL